MFIKISLIDSNFTFSFVNIVKNKLKSILGSLFLNKFITEFIKYLNEFLFFSE